MDEEPPPRALLVAILLGAVAVILGAATLIGYGEHLLDVGQIDATDSSDGTVAAYVAGNAVLVLAQTFACAVFLALTITALAVRRLRVAGLVAIVAAVAAPVWLIVTVKSQWKPGWYFILDPNGGHPASRLLLFASIGQVVALIAVAVVLNRRATPTPAP
jgi:hypothetical protein